MKAVIFMGIVTIMAASCVAMDVTQELNEKLLLSHIDGFLETHGHPDNIQIKKDGTWAYQFTLGKKVTYGSHTEMQATEPDGLAGVVTKTPYEVVVKCVIAIYTDKNGVITGATILADSVVNFSTSRCMQVFQLPVEKDPG